MNKLVHAAIDSTDHLALLCPTCHRPLQITDVFTCDVTIEGKLTKQTRVDVKCAEHGGMGWKFLDWSPEVTGKFLYTTVSDLKIP